MVERAIGAEQKRWEFENHANQAMLEVGVAYLKEAGPKGEKLFLISPEVGQGKLNRKNQFISPIGKKTRTVRIFLKKYLTIISQ